MPLLSPRCLLALLLALPGIAAAADAGDFAGKVVDAIGRTCASGAAQTLVLRDFDSVSLSGNGGVDPEGNAVLISAGSPVSIRFRGPEDGRSLAGIKCNLKVTPIFTQRGGKLVLQRIASAPDPFMTKVLSGDLEGVREIIDAGQDINVAAPMTPLMAAAGRSHLAVTRLLLDRGARINAQGQNGKTALHIAAESGPLDVAALLIERGAKVDWLDKAGHTPLWGAAFYNRPEMIELLLQHGAKLGHRDRNGNTALAVAATNGADDAIRKLVERGLKPDTGNKFGRTPLFDAIDAGKESTVALFIEYKVNLNAKTQSGFTPLSLARTRNHPEIVELLRKSGAR